MNARGKTAVLYARYSSDKQREASIDDQIRVCRTYCESEGIKVLKTYADHALSGKTDQRPQFRQMIANAPESDLVVVYMFDRFSRDRYDSAMYKRTLRDLGVRVVSASEKVDDTPEGGLQEGMLELLSEYYVADMARKIRRGMEGNALKAKDNGYKIFGYRTDPETRRYVIDDAEAKIVRDTFARYIGGSSICSLARSLTAAGVRTSKGTPVDYNWVWRLLNRRAYTGLYSWAGIEVEDGMPAIIDKETFERARVRPQIKPRKDETWATYNLSGKLYCGLCGEPMHGYGGTGKSGRRYYYYGCKERGTCKRRGMRRERVEGALASAVLQVTSDEARMRGLAHRIVEEYERQDDTPARIQACDDQISRLEGEQHNITDAVIKGFVNDELIARNEQIQSELAALREQRRRLEAQLHGVTEDEIVEFFAHGFDEGDEDFIYNTFTNRVYLFEDHMVAILNFQGASCDLAEIRAALSQGLHKKVFTPDSHGLPEKAKTPAHEGLGSYSSGVADYIVPEPILVSGGLGLIISLPTAA